MPRIGIGIGLGRTFYAGSFADAYNARVLADGGTIEATPCVNAASTLLQSASLLLIPSGYKEAKVYAEIPSTGNGDLTWSRTSDAWRTYSDGTIRRTAWNLLQYSEQFNDVSWTKTRCSITANATAAPTGAMTADVLVEDTTASASHPISQSVTLSAGSQVVSVYVKAANRSWVQITLLSTPNVSAYFNLSNGTIGTVASATNASIQSVGNGWYRCSITAVTGAGLNTLGIYPATADGTNSFTGSGTDAIYIWGAQVIEGSSSLPYFPTTTRQNVPRLSYMYGQSPALLLEPQRTNSIRNSTMQGAVTGSPGTLPTAGWSNFTGGLTQSIVGIGVENGLNYIDVRLQGTATGTNAQIVFDTSTSNNATANQTYIFSFYSKLISGSANSYNLIWDEWSSIPTYLTSKSTSVSLTSTTTRFSLSGTTSASCTTIQPFLRFVLTIGNVYDFTFRVLQPQLELGAYFTTPIFTSGTFATRVADSFSRNNIYTNGLISSSGGTWFVELKNNVSYTGGSQAQQLGLGNDIVGVTADNFWIGSSTAARLSIWKQLAGTVTSLYTIPTDNAKIAIKWNATTADVFVNGSKVVSATVFTPTQLQTLRMYAAQVPFFIQSMALFSTPLSDSDCQLLTT